MLLAVDIGNTQTHLGAFEGEELVEHWRFQTRSGATGDELGRADCRILQPQRDELRRHRRGRPSPRWCHRSAGQFERMTERYLEADCLTIGPGVKSGMSIRIDNPLEVGADRLVNAIAAYERFGEACVVGQLRHRDQRRCGLRRRCPYLGGAIGPGLEIALDTR